MTSFLAFNPFDIHGSMLQLIWNIFVTGPLLLINVFNKVINYISGGVISDMLFKSSSSFDFKNLPYEFWIFVGLSAAIFGLVFVIQILVIQFKNHSENKTMLIKALQNACKAFCFIFLIPIFFFIANICFSGIGKAIISVSSGKGSIAQYLWHIGDGNWKGDDVFNTPTDFSTPPNIKSYNITIEIFGVWFMFIALFFICLILMQKVLELFFLFIISPAVMITMVFDDGKRAFVWKDMVIAKFLASSATLLGLNIFMSLTHMLLSMDMGELSDVWFGKQLAIVIFLCAGGILTYGLSSLVASLVGESVGISEGLGSIKSTIAGGMFAAGATKMVGRAIGLTKRKGYKATNQNNLSEAQYSSDEALDKFEADNQGTGRVADRGPIRHNPRWEKRSILGIAAGTIGATVSAASALKSAHKIGGKRGVTRQIRRGFSKPFRAIGSAFNPQWKSHANFHYKTAEKRNYFQEGKLFDKQTKANSSKVLSDKQLKKIDDKEKLLKKLGKKYGPYKKEKDNHS